MNKDIWAYKRENIPGDSIGVTAMDIFTALPLIAFSFQCHLYGMNECIVLLLLPHCR